MSLLKRRHNQAGLTLIELLVSMAIGGMLMGFVFGLFSQMSVAYKRQGKSGEVSQSLRSAKDMIKREIMNTGSRLNDGFRSNLPGGLATTMRPALQVINNIDANRTDAIKLYYADASAQAALVKRTDTDTVVFGANNQWFRVDDASDFRIGDIVVITNPEVTSSETNGAPDTVHYEACLARISEIQQEAPVWRIYIQQDGSAFNTASNLNCAAVKQKTDEEISGDGGFTESMVYKFRGRAFKIGPSGIPNMTGLLYADDGDISGTSTYELAGIGFVDLQVATRYYESNDISDVDGDGDPLRDWYSGDNQEVNGPNRPGHGIPTHVSLSVVAHSLSQVKGVATAKTPKFIDTARPDNNKLGDQNEKNVATDLRLYRHFTTFLDLRSIGTGKPGSYSPSDAPNWSFANWGGN